MESGKYLIGKRVEIPVHYDMWMRGARFGVVTAFRWGKPGQSDYVIVKMDNTPQRVKVWRPDWNYMKKFAGIVEATQAIDAGKEVFWANTGYVCFKDKLGQYLCTFTRNQSTWGLKACGQDGFFYF